MTSEGDGAAEAAAQLELELAVLTRRLDIDVPADLAGGVLRGYRALREMTALLRRAASTEQSMEQEGARGA